MRSRPKADKGPRAVGLVELAPNGGARLVPVVIMIDGQFYDAAAYQASPVPMALTYGTVYEAERSGTSLGLFTVGGALQSQQNKSWIAEGKWVPAGSAPAKTSEKAETKPRGVDEDADKPPVLLRRTPLEKEKPKPADSAPQPAAPATPPASAPAATAPSSAPAPAAASAPSTPTPSTPAAAGNPAGPASPPPAAPAPSASSAPPDDTNGPKLRRGKFAIPKDEPNSPAAAKSGKPGSPSTLNSSVAKIAPDNVQIIPAISDAGGPEPRPYAYTMKPPEEQRYRTKMLAMAADEVRARVKELSAAAIAPANPTPAHARLTPGKTATPAKLPPPTFTDVQLRVFDLTTSNEPVLVLTATAQLPPGRNSGPPNLQYMLTLVAREDIYGDLNKAFSSVTDVQHLDVQPRYELIDAVDADGDGRGELLFRKVSDDSSAYSLYRVIGNQLWPLYDGAL